MPEAGAGMRVEHPRAAAARVTELVEAIAESLAGWAELNKPATEVGPQPCDGVEVTRSVLAEEELYEEPWYVDYSPYMMMYVGYGDLPSHSEPDRIIGLVRDRLTVGGWRPLRSTDGGLVIESPHAGYGARLVGVADPPGPRMGVYVASPCLRHPAERG